MSTKHDGTIAGGSEYPLVVHTRVLGVDITVRQDGREMSRRGRHESVEYTSIKKYGPPLPPGVRRDLAAWARRNLFGGARPS